MKRNKMYSINVSTNEGIIYHIQVPSNMLLDDHIDFDVVDENAERDVVRSCGFNPDEVYYETIPISELTVMNYVYDPTVVGNMRRI